MTAAVLQLLCTGAAVTAAVVWALLAMRLGEARGGTARGGGGPSGAVALVLSAAAVALLAARIAAVAALGAASLAFLPDRMWGLALSASTTAIAVVAISRRWRAAPALAGGAAAAAVAELVLTHIVGAPVALWAGAAAVVAVLAATAAWTIALLRLGRRPVSVAIAAGAVAVLALGAVGAAGVVGPGALSDEGFQAHGHGSTGTDAAAAQDGDAGATTAATGEGGTPITALRGAIDPAAPRVEVRLRASEQTIGLPSGASLEAWTFGELGGPAITATVGDVLDLRLDNLHIAKGVTVHWHGYPVPAAADGVAGVTQDAVAPGGTFRTAFTLTRPGTYWYHTHQLGSEGLVRGLYGTLVVLPDGEPLADVDVVLPLHTYGRTVVLGADSDAQHTGARAGESVRVRLVNTDQLPQRFTVSGTPFHVVAIDGTDVETDPLDGVAIEIPAGGRYDLGFTMPGASVAVRAAASPTAAMVFAASSGAAPPVDVPPARTFDPLTEVVATTAPDDLAAAALAEAAASDRFDVDGTYVLDRLPRLVHGVPQYAYTVNGAVYPHISSTVVGEGDTVRLTVVNRGFETHPMHPHGHTVRVLSVDGVAPETPLWLDTFDVGPGEVWEVAFVADNPGIWMDHCHNLEHAALGMVLHIAYRGVSTPFAPGGHAGNAPE